MKRACRRGHFKRVVELVEQGVDVNSTYTEFRLTPLHLVAKSGRVCVAEYLLEKGADINATDAKDCSPIEYAVQHKRLNMFLFLIQQRADTIFYTEENDVQYGKDLFRTAVKSGCLEIVKVLVQMGATINTIIEPYYLPIQIAIRKGHLDIIEYLLNPELRHCLNTTAELGDCQELFSKLCAKQNLPMIQLLLDCKANPNWRSEYHESPLHAASQNNDLALAQLLLDYQADVNLAGSGERTPLHLATFKGNHEMVNLLIRNGANLEARNDDGRTPISKAAERGHIEIVKTLISHQANLDNYSSSGTPLSLALGVGRIEIVKILIEAGADLNNFCPLYIAIKRFQFEVAKVLIEAKANLEFGYNYKSTLLHTISEQGNLEGVKLLLKSNANINVIHQYERYSALHLAAAKGHQSIVELLLDWDIDRNLTDKVGRTAADLAKTSKLQTIIRTRPALLWNPSNHSWKANPNQRQEIETILMLRQITETVFFPMPIELIFLIFEWLVN